MDKIFKRKKYTNAIILFLTVNPDNKNALAMTDQEEIKYLIDATEVKGEFYDIAKRPKRKNVKLLIN